MACAAGLPCCHCRSSSAGAAGRKSWARVTITHRCYNKRFETEKPDKKVRIPEVRVALTMAAVTSPPQATADTEDPVLCGA